MRLTGRNLEALRLGIAEQERTRIQEEQFAESMDRISRRVYVHDNEVALLRCAILVAGDVLVATDDGYAYRVAGVVRRIERTTEEGRKPARDWWMTVDTAEGGSYGTSLKSDDLVLVRQKDQD